MGKTETATLTPRQRRAILALLVEKNTTEAAEAAKVNRRTLTRWLGDPLFLAELRQAEAQAIDDVSRRLVAMTGGALDTLETVMASASPNEGPKVSAAKAVLDRLLKLRELHDHEERLSKIEERLKDGTPIQQA